MRRIMIIGQSGSGKSTLARMIGDRTGLPVFHIDHIHWKSGWVERSRPEKTVLCREIHALPEWVFEGGHSSTWPERLDRCHMVIWIDVPILIRLKRVIVRSIHYRGRTRPDLPDDCPEKFDWAFYSWVWDTRKSARHQIETFLANVPSEKAVFVLRTTRDIRHLLDRFEVVRR